MSRKLRIVISCVLVVLAFGAGIFAYAHTYGGKTKEANAVTETPDYFVDEFGVIDIPVEPSYSNEEEEKVVRESRGTADNPLFILEIVPYDGMAEFGFMVAGQEPIDIVAAGRDGVDFPGRDFFYTATPKDFYFWKADKPLTFKPDQTVKITQYGTMKYVGPDGGGNYNRTNLVEADGHVTDATYTPATNGEFLWNPLSVEDCLALTDAEKEVYDKAYQDANTLGDVFKMGFPEVEYVYREGAVLTHKNTFLKESVGLAYKYDANGKRDYIRKADGSINWTKIEEDCANYYTEVYTVTPEDLNINAGLVDRADLIIISTKARMGSGFITEVATGDTLTDGSGNVKSDYKLIPYIKTDKIGYAAPNGTYGRENNVPGATFNTNLLDWNVVLKIYERVTDPIRICPIVMDSSVFSETNVENEWSKKVTLKKMLKNQTTPVKEEDVSSTQNNMTKLFLLLYQMTNPVFESFYGELTYASHSMFGSTPMTDSSGNTVEMKNGNLLTTGTFLYDKDWTNANKGSADSRKYWSDRTLLPWSIVPTKDLAGNDIAHYNTNDFGKYMGMFGIICHGAGDPYNMTSGDAQNSIRNGLMQLNGDTYMSYGFDSASSLVPDDNEFGSELYTFFNEITLDADLPVEEGDLTTADCLYYLLNGLNRADSPMNKQYRILELQASPKYEEEDTFWKPLIAAHTGSIKDPIIETMTTSEFIGSRVDCMGEYDLIYVGVNKFTGNNDPMMNFSGTNTKFSHGISTDYIYAHTGPKVTITDQTFIRRTYNWMGMPIETTETEEFYGMYGWLGTTTENKEKYFVYSGNDLTLLAYDKLKEYGAEGFPILFGSGFYSNTGVSSVVSKIDRNSYVYKLGTSASNRFNYDGLISFTESNELRELLTINSKKVDFYFASESDYPLLYDDDTTKPDSQRYINGSNINNRELKFTFKVLGPAGTTYRLKLFVDANTDGMYKKGEEDLGVTVRKADNTIASGGVVEAGKTYTVRKIINDRIGSICWKLALVENNADEEKVYASFSGVSAIKDNPSDTTDNDDILVLQIVPKNMTASLLLPTSKTDAETLGGASKTFYDLVNVEDTDGDGVKDGINGMKISFVRMTQDEVLAAIIGSGSAAAPEYPNYLKDTYDMLVLGFADRYDGVSDTTVIEKIDDFILAGRAVLYTHDGASVIGEDVGIYRPLSKTITETFRDKFGMDRYGALNNVAPENMITEGAAALDVPYIPESGSDTGKVYKTGTKSLVQGLTNGMLWRTYYPQADDDDGDRNINATKIARVNVGAITEYPYNIPETISVATTHPQIYQLDMEEKDMVVWYTLTGGTGASDYENQYYGASPKDVRNNYYIYNKANITYTGMGHDLGAFSMTIDEIKLFVNTFIAAYRAAAKPVDVQVVNDDATVNLEGKQFLCVDVDSSDAANILGNDISDTYRLQVYDSATKKYVEGATVNKKSKRVYFKLISNNSYGSSSTYDVAIKLNDGVELDGVLIKGEIGDPDNTADDSMLAVYEKSTGNFVDGKTVKYQAGDEFIYYVDVPIITEEGDHQRVITTTKAEISATMSYKYSETAEPITTVGHDEVYIMPRGLFDLD